MPNRSQTGASSRRLPSRMCTGPPATPMRLSHARARSGVSFSGSTVIA